MVPSVLVSKPNDIPFLSLVMMIWTAVVWGVQLLFFREKYVRE